MSISMFVFAIFLIWVTGTLWPYGHNTYPAQYLAAVYLRPRGQVYPPLCVHLCDSVICWNDDDAWVKKETMTSEKDLLMRWPEVLVEVYVKEEQHCN